MKLEWNLRVALFIPTAETCWFYVWQVQIRPWNLNDSDFVMDGSQPLDPRKTIFVGGVPRPLRAGIAEFNVNWQQMIVFSDTSIWSMYSACRFLPVCLFSLLHLFKGH